MKKIVCWILIKSVAPVVHVMFSDSCWYGVNKNSKPGICINVNDRNPAFMKHIKKTHKFKKAYRYHETLWTVLHELGHHFTLDYCKPAKKEPKTNKAYFNTEVEWAATEWAIKFVKHHKKLCKFLSFLMKTP